MNTFERVVVATSTVAAVNLAAAPAIGAGLQELTGGAVCQEYDLMRAPTDPVMHCGESFATRMGQNIGRHEGVIALAGLVEAAGLYYVFTARERNKQPFRRWR